MLVTYCNVIKQKYYSGFLHPNVKGQMETVDSANLALLKKRRRRKEEDDEVFVNTEGEECE